MVRWWRVGAIGGGGEYWCMSRGQDRGQGVRASRACRILAPCERVSVVRLQVTVRVKIFGLGFHWVHGLGLGED